MIEIPSDSFIEQLKAQRNQALDEVAALTIVVNQFKAQLEKLNADSVSS